MAKRAINWTEIKERWILDEKPRVIAKDYKNLTSAMISTKAYKDDWKSEKVIKSQKISTEIETKIIENILYSRERILQELAYIAYMDMADCATIGDSGEIVLKTFDQMPLGASRTVQKIKQKKKVLMSGSGDEGKSASIMSVELEYGHFDKVKALIELWDKVGLNKDDGKDKKVQKITVVWGQNGS